MTQCCNQLGNNNHKSLFWFYIFLTILLSIYITSSFVFVDLINPVYPSIAPDALCNDCSVFWFFCRYTLALSNTLSLIILLECLTTMCYVRDYNLLHNYVQSMLQNNLHYYRVDYNQLDLCSKLVAHSIYSSFKIFSHFIF